MGTQFNNSGMDFRQDERFLEERGDLVTLSPAVKCTCTDDKDPNRANANCRACKGLGYVYQASQVVRLVVSAMSSQKQLMASGNVQPGDIVLTQPMMVAAPIADMDRVILSWDGQPYEGDLVTRGNGLVDLLVYSASKVTFCGQMDPLSGTVTTYVEGTDFTHVVNSDDITWLPDGNRPALGTVYSVKYLAIYEWITIPAPAQRFERGTDLGGRVFARRKDLVLAK